MRKGFLLSNVRIVEVGEGRVGPWAGLLLADLGAEVIKVESITRPDMTRGITRISFNVGANPFFPDYPDGVPGERHWNRCCEYTARNLSKLGITLDLTKPRGLEVFMRLIKASDVFLSNMAAGNAEKLGFAYDVVAKVNPKIVYISSTGYGRSGPYAKRVAMGSTIDAAAGLWGLRDYGDGDATAVSADTHCDSIGALTNAFAILTGLHYRRKTGKGTFMDVSMVEPSICHIAEAIMAYSMNKTVWHSLGNRDATMTQGCYPCQGKDQWVTLSIASDEEFQKFARIMGKTALARDKRFSNTLGRLKNQDELDAIIEGWTREHTKFEIMEMLQKAGIAAGAVLDSADLYKDAHAKEREFFETVDQPEVGQRTIPGRLWKLGETEVPKRQHAPTLGEHNTQVLTRVAGLSEAEVTQLERDKIIGTVPVV